MKTPRKRQIGGLPGTLGGATQQVAELVVYHGDPAGAGGRHDSPGHRRGSLRQKSLCRRPGARAVKTRT